MSELLESLPADLVASRDVCQVWHDTQRPFRVTPAAVRRGVAEGDWILLFNAITLACTPVRSE